MSFYRLWFPEKDSESAKARETKKMNLNARNIVVVHISFRFFDYVPFYERG